MNGSQACLPRHNHGLELQAAGRLTLALSGWYTEACVCMRAAAMSAFPSGT